jgi:phosphatidylserine synthase
MLLSEGVYKRVPVFWMIAGLLFVLLGLSGGGELRFLFAYFLLGALCIARSLWIYQARWKRHKRNQMFIARDTVVIKHPVDTSERS